MSLSGRQQRIDERYMFQALELASQAARVGEVPVGALVVSDDRLIAKAGNRCILDQDPSAHAEVLAIRQAAKLLRQHRLDGATLYVTLEPCLMCCGLLLQARMARLVFAAREPRTGAVVSIHDALRIPGVDHHVAITEGVCAEQAATLLQVFFQERRRQGQTSQLMSF